MTARLASVLTALALVTSGSAAARDQVSRPRFAVPPIVVIERDSSSGAYVFSVFVRLDRALPRDRSGAPRGELRVADAGGDAPIGTVSRRSHCYEEPVDPSFTRSRVLRHPRVGRPVPVRLYLGSRLMDRATVPLSREISPGSSQAYARALGC